MLTLAAYETTSPSRRRAALLLTVPASAERDSASAFLGLARPSALAIVDANRDGKPDVVSANVHNSMSFFLGIGDGSLGRYAVTPHKGQHPGMASADFNGDGVPDYVVANYEGSVSIFIGSSSGVFSPVTRTLGDRATIGAMAADFNRDGKVDVACLNSRSADVGFCSATGTGPSVRRFAIASAATRGRALLPTSTETGTSTSSRRRGSRTSFASSSARERGRSCHRGSTRRATCRPASRPATSTRTASSKWPSPASARTS